MEQTEHQQEENFPAWPGRIHGKWGSLHEKYECPKTSRRLSVKLSVRSVLGLWWWAHFLLSLSVLKANLNIPMGALRPGAGLPAKRKEETQDTEEVRNTYTVEDITTDQIQVHVYKTQCHVADRHRYRPSLPRKRSNFLVLWNFRDRQLTFPRSRMSKASSDGSLKSRHTQVALF